MHKKSNLKLYDNFSGDYLSEDLAYLRAKMLKGVKEVGKNKFICIHIINRKMQMKQLAWRLETIKNKIGDPGTENWLTIDSPGLLFKHETGISFVNSTIFFEIQY